MKNNKKLVKSKLGLSFNKTSQKKSTKNLNKIRINTYDFKGFWLMNDIDKKKYNKFKRNRMKKDKMLY